MKKNSTTNKKIKVKSNYQHINLHGHDIKIYKDKILIVNKDNLNVDSFLILSKKIITYLHDENFIEDGDYDILMEKLD